MKTIQFKKKLSGIIAVSFIFLLALSSCKKDSAGNSGSAVTAIKITDAPIDDASVSGAFVTISDIKLDGQSIQGFSKTTIDVAAYRNGATKTIGNFNLEGKNYSSITFVLDFDADASGNAPGCYVLATNGVKHKLQTTSNSITVTKSFALQSSSSNSIVADFDLRKMIIHQSGGASDHYEFVTSAELQSAVRLVVENQTGTISGTLTDNISASGKVVAYAYKKGTFNRSSEIQGQGSSSIEFKNAVSSAVVSSGGAYQLNFLESGTYEIHFASYKDTNADGEFELKGTLVVVGAGSLDLLGLTVNSNSSLTVNATATGVLNL